MAQVARKLVLCNMDIGSLGASAFTPCVQVPNAGTKITVQFKYKLITSPVLVTLFHSLDGIIFDECQTIDEMPIAIELDVASTSATLFITELLTSWIRFKVEKQSSIHGTLEKFIVLFAS